MKMTAIIVSFVFPRKLLSFYYLAIMRPFPQSLFATKINVIINYTMIFRDISFAFMLNFYVPGSSYNFPTFKLLDLMSRDFYQALLFV